MHVHNEVDELGSRGRMFINYVSIERQVAIQLLKQFDCKYLNLYGLPVMLTFGLMQSIKIAILIFYPKTDVKVEKTRMMSFVCKYRMSMDFLRFFRFNNIYK